MLGPCFVCSICLVFFPVLQSSHREREREREREGEMFYTFIVFLVQCGS